MHGSSILLGDNTVPGVQLSRELKEYIPKILKACKDWGLDFYPTVVQVLTYDEISEIAAYGGFPVRYPHWSFGMEYEELQRGYEHGFHKIYELVVNTNPCYIYNLSSNTLADHLTVVAHATGHNDFFKNNIHFSATDTNMLNKMANHGTRIRKYMARWGKEKVTEFIDHVMRLQTLIDGSEAWTERRAKDVDVIDKRNYRYPKRLHVDQNRSYMDPFINTKDFKDKELDKVQERDIAEEIGLFKEPTKNILAYLRDYAPLKPWQADIVSMLYEEAMYFYPQRLTKVMNEGFACLRENQLILTSEGYIRIGDIVKNKLRVKAYDGMNYNGITNYFEYANRKTIKLVTRRGYEIDGSENHRILDSNLEWKQLKDWKIGDQLTLWHGCNAWPIKLKEITWKPKKFTKTLSQISLEHKIDRKDVYVIGKKGNYSKIDESLKNDILLCESELNAFGKSVCINNRKDVIYPEYMSEEFSSLLGYLCGDGHISEKNREFGLTSGDEEQIDRYILLCFKLFGLDCRKSWDDSSLNGRWRAICYSKHIEDLFVHLGFETGVCAKNKKIPDIILQSPKKIVSAFLQSCFDCDAYAGKEGVILSSSSMGLIKQVQLLLLNYNILSNLLEKDKGNYHLMITGLSAERFYHEIGFGLKRKQEALYKCIFTNRSFFMQEKWDDEIVAIESGIDTVYDITVDKTHRYVGQSFINHNSTVDSVIMAEQGLISLGQKSHDCGIVEYAQHKMGVLGGKYSMNPYKLGYYLFKSIRERWDKGQFGREWEECTNVHEKENWDLKLGLGKEKIFEVRKYYDDVTFIHEFFTEDFCREQEYFHWKHYPNGEFRLEGRDYKTIKKKLMQRHLNGGLPDIRLTEPNYKGKGVLFLQHYDDGRTLYQPYIQDVLASINFIWEKKVILSTKDNEGDEMIYVCDNDFCKRYDREEFMSG